MFNSTMNAGLKGNTGQVKLDLDYNLLLIDLNFTFLLTGQKKVQNREKGEKRINTLTNKYVNNVLTFNKPQIYKQCKCWEKVNTPLE